MNKRRGWYYAMIAPALVLVLWLSGTAVLAEQQVEKPSISLVERSEQRKVLDGCWQVESTPDFGSGDEGFFGTTAISATDVWAVGTYLDSGIYQTLTMHWDGARWRFVSSPYPQGQNSRLRGVAGLGSNDVWAVGDAENLSLQRSTLTMHWDGTGWSIIPSPNVAGESSTLLDVAVIASNNVWAVGYSGASASSSNALVLHWNGIEWSEVSLHSAVGASVLYGISSISANNVWAVGRTYDPSTGIYRTLTIWWNGSAWAVVPSPNPGPEDSTLSAVSAVSSSNVWAVGRYKDMSSGEQRFLTLIMRWNGSAWSVVPSPNSSISNLNNLFDVAAIAGNDVWAVGSYLSGAYRGLTLHWDGSAWAVVPEAYVLATGNSLQSVDGAPGGAVRAVGYSYSGITSRRLVTRYDPVCAAPTATPTQPVPTATPTPCVGGSFSDVPPDNTFYPQITCLANRGIVSGYSDCTFRPNNEVTRGQLAKIVSNAAGFSEEPGVQIYEDVPPTDAFYQWINRLSRRGHMGGYACGGVGEPCVNGDRPYFRPVANATRGQTSKIVANAAGFVEEPTEQTFEDVPVGHTFYREIQRLASRNIMGGYPCGGAGEPCLSGKPYFRPQNNVTRGQSAKIGANTFFPGCATR